MNVQTPRDALIPNILVPRSLLADEVAFGGAVRSAGGGDLLHGDLIIDAGRALGLAPAVEPDAPARIATPRLAECHVHLDKCHTVHRMGGVGGDLAEAIAIQAEDRAEWTEADIRARAARGLNELIAAGCGAVRTHVDWTGEDGPASPPPAWRVLIDLAAERSGEVRMQIAPLTGVEEMLDADVANAIGRIAVEGGVLGVFLFDQPHRREAVESAFRVAARFGLALDFHVDEGLADG
ncbi:MAG: amidohydrolase, partial [Pseudomonadota bacterium]